MGVEAAIVGCGMVTPVGLSAPETAASARARVQRLTEIEWRDGRFKPFTVGLVPEEGLPELHADLEAQALQYREQRMLRLADPALREAIAAYPRGLGPVPLLLALPEHKTTVPLDADRFLSRLATQTGLAIDRAKSATFPSGRAGGLLAARRALELLAEGKTEFVLIGGVDSLLDLYILGTLDMEKRVRTEVNADGFTPGEGAAFLLLATGEAAGKRGLPILAKLLGAAADREDGHLYAEAPYLGEGLSRAFEALFAATPPPAPVGSVYASFNGEHYWGKEFGVAALRNGPHLDPERQMEHPAECFGDLGAAHGPVILGLAAMGLRDGYRRAPALAYCSSDHEDRAAALLDRA